MWKRFVIALALLAVTGALWFANRYYPDPALTRGVVTGLALTAVYVLGKIVVEEVATKRTDSAKTRYVIRKSISVLSLAAAALVVFSIWVTDPAALFVAYGLVGAGVAIALQDVFKNFVGGITLFITGTYHVGDRVEIGGTAGDVIDIGLMYTRLLEIQGWVTGDQATGRIVTVPNGAILGSQVTNFTADNSFIWEEIVVPITYDSDWRSARETITDIAREETADVAESASEEIEQIRRKYFLSSRQTEPRTYLELTDNWINVHVRYVTDVRDRRRTTAEVHRRILEAVSEADDVTIASETVDIVGFPGADDAANP